MSNHINFRKLLAIGFIALFSCYKAFGMRTDSLMLERMFRYAKAIQDKQSSITTTTTTLALASTYKGKTSLC